MKCSAKGRTNIELREQFILADGVSQSMAAFTPRRSIPNAAQNGNNLPPYMNSQGPIIKVNSYESISSTKFLKQHSFKTSSYNINNHPKKIAPILSQCSKEKKLVPFFIFKFFVFHFYILKL